MCVQARWDSDSSLLTLPNLLPQSLYLFSSQRISSLPQLLQQCGQYEQLARILRPELEEQEIEEVWAAMERLPLLEVAVEVNGEKVMMRMMMIMMIMMMMMKVTGRKPCPVTVRQNEQSTVSVTLSRRNRPGREGIKVRQYIKNIFLFF